MSSVVSSLTWGELVGWIAGILAVLSTIIQIAPIKLNPWSWLARRIGSAINHDTNEKVDKVAAQVRKLQDSVEASAAKLAREKILEFGDNLIFQPERRHSKDRFDDVVQHITRSTRRIASNTRSLRTIWLNLLLSSFLVLMRNV